MEGIERTNVVMVYPNQKARFVLYNLYAIDMDQKNRNYYNCRVFGHLVKNCRNRDNRIRKSKRLEYGNNGQRNLNGNKNLIVLD